MKTLLLTLTAAAAAFAQQTVRVDARQSVTQDENTVVYVKQMLRDAEILGAKGGFMGSVIKQAPYSGEEVSESTQVLADGTRIHNETRTSVYRDAEGRVRRETPDSITIWDPVANASYFLNPKDQTYRQMPLAVQFFSFAGSKDGGGNVTVRMGGGMASGNSAMIPAPPPPVPGPLGATTQMVWRTAKTGPEQTESLGRQNVEGVPADGTRQTSTIEAGAIGNDRPIQITSERWYSPDLQVALVVKHNDPRTGEESFRLINVTRGDQPANLFALPAGYQKLENK